MIDAPDATRAQRLLTLALHLTETWVPTNLGMLTSPGIAPPMRLTHAERLPVLDTDELVWHGTPPATTHNDTVGPDERRRHRHAMAG